MKYFVTFTEGGTFTGPYRTKLRHTRVIKYYRKHGIKAIIVLSNDRVWDGFLPFKNKWRGKEHGRFKQLLNNENL